MNLMCCPCEQMVDQSSTRTFVLVKSGFGFPSPYGSSSVKNCKLLLFRASNFMYASILRLGINDLSESLSAMANNLDSRAGMFSFLIVKPAALGWPPPLISRSAHSSRAEEISNPDVLLALALPVWPSKDITIVGL